MAPASPEKFVQWFRAAAPYIHTFRGRTFVIAFGGEVVQDGKFVGLTHDLNLLASLGVRLVLVHGARAQVDARLKQLKHRTRYVRGLRVTDDVALQCAKEASGRLCVEIEALLSMGLPNSPMAGADIRVASGNFVTARPIGVLDGIDLQHTGEVRKVHTTAIRDRLDHGELVLLSPLGYSPTGEIFNLALENVAEAVAVALHADKLVFLMDNGGVTGKRGQLLRELTSRQAQNLLAKSDERSGDVRLYLPCALRACQEGVGRAHLISRRIDGGLLLELFTHQGIGTMVTPDAVQSLREARIDDIGGILQLIEPLEAEGLLVKRSRDLLEMEIARFVGPRTRPHGDRLRRALSVSRGQGRGARLPCRASGIPQCRRGRAPAPGNRGAGAPPETQNAVRAHHPRRTLVCRTRFCRGGPGGAAPP